jgi:hypothetical protein
MYEITRCGSSIGRLTERSTEERSARTSRDPPIRTWTGKAIRCEESRDAGRTGAGDSP